ncbi:MAG: hypothetical protein ACJAYB_002619 [Psychromonas sp.]|jgi:hypothetical protein
MIKSTKKRAFSVFFAYIDGKAADGYGYNHRRLVCPQKYFTGRWWFGGRVYF